MDSLNTELRPGFDPMVGTGKVSKRITERIVDLCERFPTQVSHIIESQRYVYVPEIRDVRQQWVPNVIFTKWIYDTLSKLTRVGVERIGTLSYLVYNVGDHYSWHADVCEDHHDVAWRKWAGSIQLSDPADYDGGELQLKADPQDYVADKTQGAVLMFSPEICHRVTPVTRGTRRALVFWTCAEGEMAPQKR